MSTPATNTELSREEKLKRRQEQLAAWKQRKEQAETAKNDEVVASVDEDKKRERQKRLEEWKKRKLGSNTPSPVPTKKAVSVSARIMPHKTVRTLKKSVLESEDEETETDRRPHFVKPSMAIAQKKRGPAKESQAKNEEEDELDKFLNSIKEDKAKDVIELNESDSDEEIDAEEEEKQLLQSKMQKLKEREKLLDSVDHSTVAYIPFRKDFYQAPKEFAALSEEEISRLRYNLSEIVVRGENCPIPISKWSQLGLSSPVMSVLERLEYPSPSPIQSQALPAIMSGRDLIGVAKTGSGKTLAFVLPMLRHVQDQPPLAKGDGPIALVLTPTRELALQIHRELSNFKVLGLTSCCCYGGSAIESQIAELKRGVQIVVGTPGRVIDLLTVNGGRVTNLHRVTYLVLDEADRMFDMGFEPQVTKIFNQVRPDKQTVLFSATFPKKMEALARKGLENPIEIVVGGISKVGSEITQKVEIFQADEEAELNREKFSRLIKLLDEFFEQKPGSKVLIFVEKQDAADKLMVQLISSDYPSLSIHGGKEQIDRKHAIKEFSHNSGVNVLIATSIAARGLDVKGLDLVINYDAPSHMEDYVHRVGRTGRAGRTGTAVTFVTTQQERSIADLVRAMKLSGQQVDPQLMEIRGKFVDKVKSGKEKYASGFGGNGLEKLQQVRESARDLERRSYEDKSGISSASGAKPAQSSTATPVPESEVEAQLPDFTIIEGRAPETSGPDKCKFHSRITINELPQTARWAVVARDSLGKIIEASGTSITSKGQYYGPNAKVSAEVPRLYLLVEGLTEAAVRAANTMIRQKMIEGLQLAQTDPKALGKYTV